MFSMDESEGQHRLEQLCFESRLTGGRARVREPELVHGRQGVRHAPHGISWSAGRGHGCRERALYASRSCLLALTLL